MKMTTFVALTLSGLAVLGTGCGSVAEPIAEGTSGLNRATTSDMQLNLSHVQCAEDGTVEVHFVLLFAGDATPGTLTGTYDGGSFSIPPGKNSGNAWHYTTYLPSGDIDITSASVVANGTTVTLHNPDAYAGEYLCGAPECAVKVTAQDLLCTAKPIGNPTAECAYFGLVAQGKDDALSGLTFTATQGAYVAIVKSGSRGCGPGNSAYRVYVNVKEGQVLSTPVNQDISHVTYCACPE